jgi:hypothetical protein
LGWSRVLATSLVAVNTAASMPRCALLCMPRPHLACQTSRGLTLTRFVLQYALLANRDLLPCRKKGPLRTLTRSGNAARTLYAP